MKSDPTELEPLTTGSEPEVQPEVISGGPEFQSTSANQHPVEPNVVVLRNRSTRKTTNQSAFVSSARPRGHVQDTSTSCTIRKDSNHCQSDPERLSVSDNKGGFILDGSTLHYLDKNMMTHSYHDGVIFSTI